MDSLESVGGFKPIRKEHASCYVSRTQNLIIPPAHSFEDSRKHKPFIQTHRIHVWYIYTYIYHTNQPNVGKYTNPMDPTGNTAKKNHITCFDPWKVLKYFDPTQKFHESNNPKDPEPSRSNRMFWAPIPSEKNRNVGVIPFLGHTWILRASPCSTPLSPPLEIPRP